MSPAQSYWTRNMSSLSMGTREKHLGYETHHQQVPFAQVVVVFQAALLLGVGGGFLLACVLTVTSMIRVPQGIWRSALAQAHGYL